MYELQLIQTADVALIHKASPFAMQRGHRLADKEEQVLAKVLPTWKRTKGSMQLGCFRHDLSPRRKALSQWKRIRSNPLLACLAVAAVCAFAYRIKQDWTPSLPRENDVRTRQLRDENLVKHETWEFVQEGTKTKNVYTSTKKREEQPWETAQTPKVALLFLTQEHIIQEPVWRAFFEAASRVSPQQAPPLRPERVLEDLVGPLFPPLDEYPDEGYPGYQIQHGLAVGGMHDSPILRQEAQRSAMTEDKDEDEDWGDDGLDLADVAAAWSGAAQQLPQGSHESAALLRAEVERLMSGISQQGNPYYTQDLFTVYVHSTGGRRLPAGSLFEGREIDDSVNTTNGYGQHVLAEAARKLLQAALRDPRNMKFVLMSDSSVPLYPPQVVYAQMMAETKSRVQACAQGKHDEYRWQAEMESEYLKKRHWRKSWQWAALGRVHARLAVEDMHVVELFHRYCYTNFTDYKPLCVSDEHYLPTLLAAYGLQDETDCVGQAHYLDWSRGGWHPATFQAADLDELWVARARNRDVCDDFTAISQAGSLLQTGAASMVFSQDAGGQDEGQPPLEDSWLDVLRSRLRLQGALDPSMHIYRHWGSAAGYQPMGYECHLFARKVGVEAIGAATTMALSCAGLGMGWWCDALMT